nr:low molecular weight protein-tyrosine-phosphatase [Streptomyces niger]
MTSSPPLRVCFVCTGNICRSPMAEAVFRARIEEAGLADRVVIDSAGTGGWHEGEDADPRTLAVLREAGYELAHSARQFRPEWFERLDLIIALDSGHLHDLRDSAPTETDAAKVRLLRACTLPDPGSYATTALDPDVPDPYYGGMSGFEGCLAMVEAASEDLLTVVRAALAGRDTHDERAETSA